MKKEKCYVCGKYKEEIVRIAPMYRSMFATRTKKAFQSMCKQCYEESVRENRYKYYSVELPTGEVVEYR